MATLYTFLLTGRTEESELGDGEETPASGILGTVEVSIDSDGFLRWTDANGHKRTLAIQGDLSHLVKELFSSEEEEGGLPEDVRLFNVPVLTVPGSGGRTDPQPQQS